MSAPEIMAVPGKVVAFAAARAAAIATATVVMSVTIIMAAGAAMVAVILSAPIAGLPIVAIIPARTVGV